MIPARTLKEVDQAIKAFVEGADLLEIPADTASLLEEIGFLQPLTKEPTDTAQEYHFHSHVVEDEERATGLLRAGVKRLDACKLLCGSLWGYGPVPIDGVVRLLRAHGVLDSEATAEDVRPFLHLLNAVDLIKYSKKTNRVRVLYNPATDLAEPDAPTLEEAKATANVKPFSPPTPYTNIKQLWEILRQCREYIWWADAHFSRKGLEPLSEEADGQRVKEIKILSGPAQTGDKAIRDFQRFGDEMKNRGIKAEWRVQEPRSWHDRWIIAKNICFNVPPINTIYKGDAAEAFGTANRPEFEGWWAQGTPLCTL